MSNDTKTPETFSYTYSASQQAEIKAIRARYLPQEEDRMTQLRRLDASATRKGTTAALVLGIISALILGLGMCCCMVWADQWFFPGIVIGLIGILGVSMAYPVYNHITRRQREKIAPEILRLTDELLK